jgi:hypothetical protein
MGSWWSTPETIRIAVIGHTQTGKSHFVDRVSGGDGDETRKQTYGTYAGNIGYGGRRLEFVETGFLARASLQTLDGYDCVMWFIDSHSTLEEILEMRNYVVAVALGVVAEQSTRKRDRRNVVPPPRLDQISSVTRRVPLCIVHNTGRPFPCRHNNNNNVAWTDLRQACQVNHLQTLYSDIVVTQLSYTDADAPRLLFDWIIDSVAK